MIANHMRKISRREIMLAMAQAGKDTGKLKSSFSYDIYKGAKGPSSEVKNTAEHAYLHHEGNGSPGGRIYPKKASTLRFKYKGKIIYAQSVRTAKPNRYLTDNMRKAIL